MQTHSRLFKAMAQTLVGVMSMQPLLSMAADLRVDASAGGTAYITQAGNGVPMVIIAKPNEKGLSHNKFSAYNVDQQGLILNNSTQKYTQTALSGTIIGNGYLQGQPAQLILNEVTGGQASQLKGYTEVAGHQAHVVVANPHGMTCDGCGFINTPHVSLATGQPIIEQGRLARYEVSDGQIEIAGAGLNATNISQFDLITRSAKINAELYANQLNIVTGRNSVDAHTLDATAKTDRVAGQPHLAIDSSALGGMYAGAIRLVGTEAGVGVKLSGDMAASAGDIQIETSGKLSLARVSAQQQIKMHAAEIDLTAQIYAADHIDIQAQKLTNKNTLLAANGIDLTVEQIDNPGLIEAGLQADNTLNSSADIRITSTTLNNSGSVIASRDLQIDSKEQVSNQVGQLVADTGLTLNTQQLDNQQGLITAAGTVAVSAQQIDNLHQGEISSQQQLTVRTDILDNSDSGRVIGEADVLISAQTLDNHQSGIVVADNSLTIRADHIDNRADGLLLSHGVLDAVAHQFNNQQGSLIADAGMMLQGHTLNNDTGRIASQNTVLLDHAQLSNAQGLISAGAALNIQAEQLDNQHQGVIVSDGVLSMYANQFNNYDQGLLISQGALHAQLNQLDQHQGGQLISADSIHLNLSGGNLNNSQGGLLYAPQLHLEQVAVLNNSQGGEVSSPGNLLVSAQQLNNVGGSVSSGKTLQVRVDGLINNSLQGLLSAGNDLHISAESINNSQSGMVNAQGDVFIQAENRLDNSRSGAVLAGGQLQIASTALDNSQSGVIVSNQLLNIQAQHIDNQQEGLLSGLAGVQVFADSLNNQNLGTLSSQAGDLTVQITGQLNNNDQGALVSQQSLNVQTGSLDNQHGIISAQTDVVLQVVGDMDNQRGQVAGQNMTLSANSLDNTQGHISADQALTVTLAEQLFNHQNASIISGEKLLLTANRISNQNSTLASEGLLSVFAQQLRNEQQATIAASDHVQLNVQQIDNHSRIYSQHAGLTVKTDVLNNQGGGLYAQQQLVVTGQYLDNSAQGQIAANRIDFSLTGALNNQSGLVEADQLYISADSVANSQGRLRALTDTGDSVIRTNNMFDNRHGSIEIANTNFTLDAPHLMNQSGAVAHAGLGLFDLSSGHALDVGGTVASQGELLLSSDSWENSTLFQAGALTLHVGHFTQTASGQLITSHSLTATGDTWVNNGLIASEGRLDIQLTGNYSGDGQIISLGDMQLSANQFTLGQPAVIYSEASVAINGQTLSNQGHISAAGALAIDTQELNNRGTLSSAQQLSINTGYLLNENASILSGADMVLRVGQLTNRYANIYSLGNIDLAGDATSSQAQRVENISGSIEAGLDFSLHSAVVENHRDILDIKDTGKYSVVIHELPCRGAYNPYGDCKLGGNGRRVGVWEITEREKLEVINSSAASNLLAGGTLSLSGASLFNSSSLISSGADLNLSFNEVHNIGVKPADIEAKRVFVSGRKPDYYTYLSLAGQFNAKHMPAVQAESVEQDLSHFIASMESEYLPGRELNETLLAGEEYSGIIQAGGTVTINAQQTLENSVIRPGYSYVSGGSREDNNAPGSNYATQVNSNSQLPPDLQQKQIDPTVLPGFSVPTGDKGLFRLSGQTAEDLRVDGKVFAEQSEQDILLRRPLAGSSALHEAYEKGQVHYILPNLQNLQGQSSAHGYLIETNPALTNMQHFLSSDHLLGGLGFSTDHVQKRLGDGLYEQKVIRDALVARTGQRFIAGIDSDEAMYRYLMDNAIASKEALQLSVGVSLSADQVAALTHDIVWLEEREVLGEKVLTPVLYMAQADGRLAPNGALIQGGNLTLVSGGDLSNQGTLGASQNFSAYTQNIDNSGLIHAGERLSLLAGDSLYSRQGGIITGRDVDLTARTGDILNERTVTRHASAAGNSRWETSFADNAAHIEATRDLTLMAGRDVHNLGGVLNSQGDLHISAGRDVNLASAEERHSTSHADHYLNAQSQQLGSETLAGGRLDIQADRDLTAIASRIESGKDMQLIAGNDLTLASAADESHSYSKSKKASSQHDQVRQVGTEVQAGGQLIAVAGQDLTLVSSSVAANDEAYLVAGGEIQLLAEQDYDYAFSEKKKKGSLGRKSYRMDESLSDTAVVSSVSSGSNLSIYSGDNFISEGARLNAEGKLELQAVNDIQLLAAQDSYQQARAKSKKGLVSSKAKTSEQSQTTAVGSMLTGQDIIIRTGRDLLVSGSDIRSETDTHLQAGRDIHLMTAEQQSNQSSSRKSSRLSFSNHGLLAQTKKRAEAEQVSTDAVGSYISADNLIVSSGRDSQIQGSVLIAEQNMSIFAGRDLTIGSSENSASYAASSSRTQSGDIGNVWQSAVGLVKHKKQTQGHTIRQSGSKLASLAANISLQAGEYYQQTASQVIAVEGDISIQAQQVSIAAGYDTLNHSEKQSSSRTAIGGTVNIPVVDAALSMQQTARAATRTDDRRMQTLAAATVAMQGKTAYDNAKAVVDGDATGIKFSVSLSNEKSKSESTQQGHNVVASSVTAGGDVHIQASGAPYSDVQIIGSTVNAGRDIDLNADRNILLLAAENAAEQNSKNSGSGWSAGIGFGIGGAQNGFSLDLAANQFRGKSDGSDSTWTNTQIEAGRQVVLESGRDTVLKGAVVKGEQVTAKVGGNLTLESLQDTSAYISKSSSSSIGASLCIPGFCAGASTVSGSSNSSKVKSDYASVTEQTGIKAGDGGFQIEVQGHTSLTGAIIASNEKAIEDNLNSLETGTLAVKDIENYSQYKASAANIAGGVTFGVGEVNKEIVSALTEGKKNTANLSGSGASQLKGSKQSITHSGISGGTIVITDLESQHKRTGQAADDLLVSLERDVLSSNGSGGLDKNWDGAKLVQKVQANAEIATAFSQQAYSAVGSYVRKQQAELQQQLEQAKTDAEKAVLLKEVKELKLQERAMNILIGAVTGTGASAVTQETLSIAASEMRALMVKDSMRFVGIIDQSMLEVEPLNNISAPSIGLHGDGVKLGGARIDLDIVCGVTNERCVTDVQGNLELFNGMVQFDFEEAGMSLEDFLTTKEGKKAFGLTGGVQGLKGTLFGVSYEAGSWQDRLIESFAGPHDMIGGKFGGLYDQSGNAERGRSQLTKYGQEAWSVAAIPVSAPFAAADALPAPVWQAISVLIKGVK